MSKRTLINLLFCSIIFSAKADDLSVQMQQINATPVQNEDILWQRMRDGFMLNHNETKEVKYWEKRYGSPKYFNIIMQNAAPYLYFVVTEMQRRGVPTELALIPIVESTYNPNAVSPAAISTGMWQFVSSSGKRFGLVQNSDLDERKDIVKSTRAAINYLIYLHDMFGSWELAIAAYNWGEGNINNAVKGANSYNFYDLDVRDVTKQYVPKVIALANIIQNPSKFGIKLTPLKNQPYFAIINPQAPLSVNQFMDMSNLSLAINKKINPQYNSTAYMVSPSQRLLLPVSNQPTYLASIGGGTPVNNSSNLPLAAAPIVDGTITADNNNSPAGAAGNGAAPPASASSDGIVALAAAGAVSTAGTSNNNNSSAAASNSMAAYSPTQSSTSVNDLLDDSGAANTSVAAASGNTVYTVASGDTLYSISKKFNVPMTQIASDNQLTDNTVKLNQKLIIRNANS